MRSPTLPGVDTRPRYLSAEANARLAEAMLRLLRGEITRADFARLLSEVSR